MQDRLLKYFILFIHIFSIEAFEHFFKMRPSVSGLIYLQILMQIFNFVENLFE